MNPGQVVLPATLCLLLSCSNDRPDSDIGNPSIPVVWQLSDEPVIEIGVLAGDPIYELHAATSSIRLLDQSIVVANTGSQELRAFNVDGQHLWSAGGRGGGPGEFRWLKRVYRVGRDSIAAYDVAGDKMSIFSVDGQFSEMQQLDRANDPEFPLDVWLHRQYWVEGGSVPDNRGVVRAALDKLPIPPVEPAYRLARVDSETNIWIRVPQSNNESGIVWTVFNAAAQVIAVIETPLQFDIHELGSDFVLGRWRNEDDVNFIRLYGLEKTIVPVRNIPRGVVQSGHEAETPHSQRSEVEGPQPESLVAAMRNLVIAQERYYAGHGQYASERDGLDWEGPEGVGMDIISAANVGWTAVFTHSETRTICGVFVGWDGPPGWTGEAIPKCR